VTMLTTETNMDPSEYGTNRNQYTQPARTTVLTFTTTQAHWAVAHCVQGCTDCFLGHCSHWICWNVSHTLLSSTIRLFPHCTLHRMPISPWHDALHSQIWSAYGCMNCLMVSACETVFKMLLENSSKLKSPFFKQIMLTCHYIELTFV
jgi:hypothetical protein